MRPKALVLMLTITLLGTASSAWAQGGSGVIVGANFANVEATPDQGIGFDRRTGFVAGIFLGLPLGSSLTIQPELLYSQKGVKFKDSGGDARIELDYLDVPVLARITSGGGGLAFVAGPSFGFKIRARGKVDIGGDSQEQDISDEVESFDFGFVLGAGAQTPKMFIDGRYQWGLSNINKDAFDATEVKNRVISLVLGFRF
jgi:hypothetical protein